MCGFQAALGQLGRQATQRKIRLPPALNQPITISSGNLYRLRSDQASDCPSHAGEPPNVKVKKYKSHKWDGDAMIGVVVPGDVEYYDVPDDVIVVTPALEHDKYVYLNDHIYIVDGDRRIVGIVE